MPPNSLLVTLDVASLYTNIPHTDGIRAALPSHNESVSDKVTGSSTLVTLLKLVLELNNFESDGVHYLQVNGTSMGKPISPNYAIIFMGILENEFLASRSLKPLYHKRFIDDIFMIWQHGEAQVLSFIHDFNNVHPSIYFTHTYSEQTINFPDITLTMRDGQLTTKFIESPLTSSNTSIFIVIMSSTAILAYTVVRPFDLKEYVPDKLNLILIGLSFEAL